MGSVAEQCARTNIRRESHWCKVAFEKTPPAAAGIAKNLLPQVHEPPEMHHHCEENRTRKLPC